MNLLAIGISHHTAPQDLRARFSFTLDQLQPSLKGLAQRWLRDTQHPEVALLSTCNRTELYCASPAELRRPAVEWLAGVGGLTARQLMEHAYVLEGPAAARHAFRVASGLDSMVLGEPHILGQMKRAMREAEQAGTLGCTLHQLFQRALFVAKAVRSQTGLGQHAVGYAAACARLAQDNFGGVPGCSVLYLGAGEMIESVALQLRALAPRSVSVANRSLQRARLLAGQLGGRALALADLPAELARHDLVVACTASQVPLITADMVQRAVQQRSGRPLLLVDLGLPRDVEPGAALVSGVQLVALDELGARMAAAAPGRVAAVQRAEDLVEQGVRQFDAWRAQRGAVPVIQAIHAQANSWRDAELIRARRALARGDDPQIVIEQLSRGLTRKMLHGALTQLRNHASVRPRDMAGAVSRLFLRCPARRTSGEDQASGQRAASPLGSGQVPAKVAPRAA